MNLLTDPLLPVELAGSETPLDLPSLLAALAREEVTGLPFLRAHQQAPFHAFCVQLAALALHHRAGQGDIPGEPEVWRDLLRRLTPQWPDDEPWRLVVADPAKPAFMQAPVPEGTADPHTRVVETPDDLDVVVTSRNHGVKQALAADAPPAAWIAALVTVQTTAGFMGAGNYGIARMNGGFATRPFIGLVPPGGAGAHWRRDVAVLLRCRDWCLERAPDLARDGGHGLLWLLPWDGSASVALQKLDPWFIEVCRRVRLRLDATGGLVARATTSKAARLAAKERCGNVGDPWIPIEIGRGSVAYNTTPHYAAMSAVLFRRDVWTRPLLLDWHERIDGPAMTARFDVLVRGQGTTEGHHRREMPIEGKKRLGMLMLPAERDRLAQLAGEMIGHARDLRLRVLKFPLLTLAQAGAEEISLRDRTTTAWVEPWLTRVDQAVEPVFFGHLFQRAEQGEAATQAWIAFLRELAATIFNDAVAAMPVAGARRMKAVAVAELRLRAALKKVFGGYLEVETADAG
ncbi:type I-E CRISPR-associated protein Cse1/CasA [Marinimicrococcus flavescens]|uniref:Type I-E CRISPR-associated protein Cse1/CasA n=1 Tax=Marinimicrococcus flavescens TaxID=3031815 RepID=A0AAP3XRC7_9PROT|nr:type I-E CRISPR-associated protein Cse1/CasA [Marinimicrococcus flavescens]